MNWIRALAGEYTDRQCQNHKSYILHTFGPVMWPLIFKRKKHILFVILSHGSWCVHTFAFSKLFKVYLVAGWLACTHAAERKMLLAGLLACLDEWTRYLNFHRHVKTLCYYYCYYSTLPHTHAHNEQWWTQMCKTFNFGMLCHVAFVYGVPFHQIR